MSTAEFSVIFAGPHASVQDAGRPGLMRFGVPASGPMDRGAFALANAALGNPPGRAAIEVSSGGLVLDCLSGSVTVALAGGGFRLGIGQVTTDGAAVATVEAGQRLSVRPGATGNWAVLAFAGDIRCARWLGSAATHSQSGLGGGFVRTGGRVIIDAATRRADRDGPIATPPLALPTDVVRIVTGPQDHHFDPAALSALTDAPFTLTEAHDRMGARLSGPRLRIAGALDMPSGPVTRGAVQVAGDGVATVLLADHQTTGGYPRIATVIGADLDRFVQLRSGVPFRFAAVTPAEAVAASRRAAADLGLALAAAGIAPVPLAQRLLAANLISGAVSGDET